MRAECFFFVALSLDVVKSFIPYSRARMHLILFQTCESNCFRIVIQYMDCFRFVQIRTVTEIGNSG